MWRCAMHHPWGCGVCVCVSFCSCGDCVCMFCIRGVVVCVCITAYQCIMGVWVWVCWHSCCIPMALRSVYIPHHARSGAISMLRLPDMMVPYPWGYRSLGLVIWQPTGSHPVHKNARNNRPRKARHHFAHTHTSAG